MDGRQSRLEVIRAEDSHADVLAEFIRHVWDPAASAASVLAARARAARHNVAEPGVPPPTWIAIQAGRVLGYVTTIPVRLWDGTRDWPAYWIKGLMVLPEHRGGPVGYLVLKAAAAALPLSGGHAVALPARRLFQAVGYGDLGALPNWVRPLAPHRILRRIDVSQLGVSRLPAWTETAVRWARRTGLDLLAGLSAGTALRLAASVRRLPSLRIETEPLDPNTSAPELDALWLAVRDRHTPGAVRDAGYLLHRYPAGAEDAYLWLAARRAGKLTGVAILRRPRSDGDPRLMGVRVATLAEVIYRVDEPAEGLALLGAAERAAQSLPADAILAASSAPALNGLLRSQCYLPFPGNVHFLFRDTSGQAPFPGLLADWWMTRGDGQADETF